MSVFDSPAVTAVTDVTHTPGDVGGPAGLLVEVETFLARFVAYPSEAARVASTLWAAHCHVVDRFESTPRIAYLSPEPGSGKSRALEVLELLVPRPVHAVNATPAHLFRKVSDEAGLPTVLFDEIDTLFGPKAKDNEDVRGMLNAGHRRGAVAGRCVMKGKAVEFEELPTFCPVALAGLGDMPDTIMTRSVVVRMRRRRPDEKVEPFRHRAHAQEGHWLRDRLATWTESVAHVLQDVWPKLPDGVEDRNADSGNRCSLLPTRRAANGRNALEPLPWNSSRKRRKDRRLSVSACFPTYARCSSPPERTPCTATPFSTGCTSLRKALGVICAASRWTAPPSPECSRSTT